MMGMEPELLQKNRVSVPTEKNLIPIITTLLRKAENEEEWNRYCDLIKSLYDGNYPNWWGEQVLLSGLLKDVSESWKKTKKKPKWNSLYDEETNV